MNYYDQQENIVAKYMRVLSREIPKIPNKLNETTYSIYTCPTCGVGLFLKSDKCYWCKQHITWENSAYTNSTNSVELEHEMRKIKQIVSDMPIEKFDNMLEKCGITCIQESSQSDYVKAMKKVVDDSVC